MASFSFDPSIYKVSPIYINYQYYYLTDNDLISLKLSDNMSVEIIYKLITLLKEYTFSDRAYRFIYNSILKINENEFQKIEYWKYSITLHLSAYISSKNSIKTYILSLLVISCYKANNYSMMTDFYNLINDDISEILLQDILPEIYQKIQND